MWLILFFGLVTDAVAKPLGWFLDGADAVRLDGARADLTVYRGPNTAYLPSVTAAVPVAGQEALRPALAIVDLGGGWSRVSVEMARALGLEWSWTKVKGSFRRIAILDKVVLDGATLLEVRLEVVNDAPGLVLGFSAIDEIAVALLASEGVLRVVPARQGEQLVRSLSLPYTVGRQPKGSWTDMGGQSFRGNGLTLQVPGALRWGEAVVNGIVHLRTEAPSSRVAPSSRLPVPVIRGNLPYHDVGALLGDVWLADTWIREDPALSDPHRDFFGALGYDVLFAMDIAVFPARGLVSFRRAPSVLYQDATALAVEFAQQRYDQEESRGASTGSVTTQPGEEKVQIDFDRPERTMVPLGDPGNPVVRDRNLDLAETLWWAGELDDAMPHYLSASRFGGDACEPHLRLAERRLAWAGPKLAEQLVAQLVVDPLQRAAHLWDVWEALDETTRDAIREGQDRPEGSLQVLQSDRCRRAHGLLMAVYTLTGADDDLATLVAEGGDNASIAYMQGLQMLRSGSPRAVQALDLALAGDGAEVVDTKVALAMAHAANDDRDAVIAVGREVAGLPTQHPLTAALGLLAASRQLDVASDVTRKVRRADDRWMPGLLVHAMATGTPPPDWPESTDHRTPHSPQVLCQRALHLALIGRIGDGRSLLTAFPFPAEADWWSARAVVAQLEGDLGTRDEALLNLRLRFPMIPLGNLGLQ